jgi:voltage-gated potassium channel
MPLGLMTPRELLHSKERFLILMCLILGLVVLVPILNRFTAARVFLEIFLTAIIISMLYVISNKKGFVIAGVLLAVVMLVSFWLEYFTQNQWIAAIGMVTGVLFVGFVISSILGSMLKSEGVDREIIYKAILLYLLAALMWAFLYTFLELVDPASFNIDLDQSKGYLLVFQYYSFVTITTLGYGDITPVTEVAKAFSVLEAVCGQLYLVVVVAWLVGMHVSGKSR